jgi:hypothetical protein
MITGNAAWTTALNAETKRPLYVLTIPSKSTQLSSFYNVIEDKYTFPTGYSDFACAQNSTTLTSASGGFSQWMINYYIQITGGTNFIVGYYQITGFTNATTITLASSPATAGAGSSGTGHIKAVKNGDNLLPVLVVPKGASQKVDELTGRSSISQMTLQTNDPSGALKTLSSDTTVIGKTAYFFMGFPGSDVNDTNLPLPAASSASFVPLHTMVISGMARDENGWMNFTLQDPLLYTADQIFINGGPGLWNQFTTSAQVSLTSQTLGGVADKRVVTLVGWDPTGSTLQKESLLLNGSTEVLSALSYSAIIALFVDAASTLYTVTVKQGSGGTVIGSIPTNQIVIGGVVGPPATPSTPINGSLQDNGFPISKNNPRYLSGNPIDILLAVNQNELGIGQTAAPVLIPITGGGSGTGQAGLGINPTWKFYTGPTTANPSGLGLLYPNTYLDAAALLAMKYNDFASDRFEFAYTSTQTGKRWVEDQILKILGLYWIVRGNGQLSPKSMKAPANPGNFLDSTVAPTDLATSGAGVTTVTSASAPFASWMVGYLLKITAGTNFTTGLYLITAFTSASSITVASSPTPGGAGTNGTGVLRFTISDRQIKGIPKTERWPIVNMVYVTLALTNDVAASSSNQLTLTFANQQSLNTYHSPYVQTIQADGLRFGLGALARLFLLINRIFARHAFATPIYTLQCYLKDVVVELGDYLYLTHPLLEDLKTGTIGVTNVLCEVVSREPDYANGMVTLQVADTRFMSASNGAFKVWPNASGSLAWTAATTLQKATYLFVSNNSGQQSDSTPANQID